MQTQHPAPQYRTVLALSICAALAACAPIPVDDERVQKSAYQRLSTYVSSGPKREAPKTQAHSNTVASTPAPAVAAQPAPTVATTPRVASAPRVATIPAAPTTITAPTPVAQAPVMPTPSVEEAPKKSKSLFGFMSKFIGGDKKEESAQDSVADNGQNWGKPAAQANTAAPQANTANQPNTNQQGFASLYGTQSYEQPQNNELSANEAASTEDAAKGNTEKKSVFGNLFSRVKNVFGKDKSESDATAANAAVEPATAVTNYPTYTPSNTQTASSSTNDFTPSDTTPAAYTAPKPNVPDQAFSAANPIYITALDLSINNLSKRLKTSTFALDERGLAFLTKGALDEDTTYKFLTETQLADHREKAKTAKAGKADGNRSLFDAMKDFMPRRKKSDLPDRLPKTMTLLNTIVVLQSPSNGGQQAIIMMKLKDNQTGIHLTDARRTIALSQSQAQSSLAIKRAIGAELPGMLERLAKNAFASLTAPEPNANQQSNRYRKNQAGQDQVSQRQARNAPRTKLVDLSSEALEARDARDARYSNSVVIDTSGTKQAKRAKTINTAPASTKQPANKQANNTIYGATNNNPAPIYRITADEILAAERTAEAEAAAQVLAEAKAAREAQIRARQAQAEQLAREASKRAAAQAQAQPEQTIAATPAARLDRVMAVSPYGLPPQATTAKENEKKTAEVAQSTAQQQLSNRLAKQIAARRAAELSTQSATQNSASQNSASQNSTTQRNAAPARQPAAKPITTAKASPTPQLETREFFGIQLMRATELGYLKDSLRRLSIDPSKVNIIRQKAQDNRIRYVAIYGQFTSQNEAQKTLDNLPEDVLSEGAFVRRVAVKARKS